MICIKCGSDKLRYAHYASYYSYNYRCYSCKECGMMTTTYEIPMNSSEHMMIEKLLRTEDFLKDIGEENRQPYNNQKHFIRSMRRIKGAKKNEQDYSDGQTD